MTPPCPYCGNKDSKKITDVIWGNIVRIYFHCLKCDNNYYNYYQYSINGELIEK